MPKTKALIAIARKLFGIIFAVARDQSIYEQNLSKALSELKEAA